MIPVPKDGQDPTFAALRADLRGLKGDASLVESVASMMGLIIGRFTIGRRSGSGRIHRRRWSSSSSLRERRTWQPWGSTVRCSGQHRDRRKGGVADGSLGVISPLGRIVQSEMRAKLDDGITLEWRELRASRPIGAGTCVSVDGRRWDRSRAGGRAGWPIGAR